MGLSSIQGRRLIGREHEVERYRLPLFSLEIDSFLRPFFRRRWARWVELLDEAAKAFTLARTTDSGGRSRVFRPTLDQTILPK